jgi:hypothetical protein
MRASNKCLILAVLLASFCCIVICFSLGERKFGGCHVGWIGFGRMRLFIAFAADDSAVGVAERKREYAGSMQGEWPGVAPWRIGGARLPAITRVVKFNASYGFYAGVQTDYGGTTYYIVIPCWSYAIGLFIVFTCHRCIARRFSNRGFFVLQKTREHQKS